MRYLRMYRKKRAKILVLKKISAEGQEKVERQMEKNIKKRGKIRIS